MALAEDPSEAVSLILGVADHHVTDAARHLIAYRQDSGYAYLLHEPCTPSDRLVLEDLGPTTRSTRASASLPPWLLFRTAAAWT
jgi:hypothetical protein